MSSAPAALHPLIAVPDGPNMTISGRLAAETLEDAR